MAAENTIYTVIFCVSFLAAFITFIGLSPPEFFLASKTYVQYTLPDYFTPADIQRIKHFLNKTVYGTDTSFDFNLAPNPVDHIIHFVWQLDLGGNHINFRLEHVYWRMWIGPFVLENWHTMDTSNFETGAPLGVFVDKTEALAAYDSELNSSVFSSQCNDVTVKLWLFDANQTRNDLSVAWDENECAAGIGFGYEDYETKLSAWDIVGRLVTFQSPEIFGATGAIAIALNFIIGIAFWAAVAISIYLLVMEAVPF